MNNLTGNLMRSSTLTLIIAALSGLSGCFQNQNDAALTSRTVTEEPIIGTDAQAMADAGSAGVRDSQQLLLTMASLTEVSPRTAAISDTFARAQDNLPQFSGLSALAGPQLIAHVKLAAEFCGQLAPAASTDAAVLARRAKFFPGVPFDQPVNRLTDAIRDDVILALTENFYRASPPTPDELDELRSLVTDLKELQRSSVRTVNGVPQESLLDLTTNRTQHIMVALCTVVLSSPKATLVF